MKSLLTVIATNMVVFVALLLLLELGVRFFHPEILPQNLDPALFDAYKYEGTYGYKALSRGTEFGALYVTDHRGFRIAGNSLQHTPGGILVLGDSVSVGIGVSASETYTAVLEEKLSKQVMNASVTGYGLSDYVAALKGIRKDLQPEQIFVGFCLNDTTGTSQANIAAMVRKTRGGAHGAPDEKRYPNKVVRMLRHLNDHYLNFNDFLKTHSRTYLLIKSIATDSARDYFSADKVTYEDPETLSFLTAEFSRLKDLAGQAKLVMLIFPYEYQLRTAAPEFLHPQKIIREAGRRAGIETYDLFDDLIESLQVNGLSSTSIYLFNDPMHFNARGHRILGELLYRRLLNGSSAHR